MKATITISKTIQESQYEPFSITITLEKEIKNEAEIGRLYEKVLKQIDGKMEERLSI